MDKIPPNIDLEKKIKDLSLEANQCRQVKKELIELEYRYHKLAGAVTDYMFSVQLENGLPVETTHSPSCVSVTGYTPEEFKNDSYLWFKMVHDEDRFAVQEQVRLVLTGQDVPPLEHRIIRKDGVIRWVNNTILLYRNHLGQLDSYEGLVQDMTERKLAEEALARSEKRYRTIFESTGTATIASDEDMTIVMVNSEFELLSGYSKDEIEGKKSWTEFVSKEDLQILKEYHRLRRVDPSAAPRKHEFRFINRYGKIRNILATVAMIPETKRGVASFMDITDLKRAEAERTLRQRLEGVLEMAGAACHELNQPLTTVMGNAELLMKDMDEDNPDFRIIKNIHDAVCDLGEITGKIMNINKYETMDYINEKIIDIDKASK